MVGRLSAVAKRHRMRMQCEDESSGANSEWSSDWIEAARGLVMKA
ncbi:hypothetical protein Pcac1_g15833 [Phytophthora cactorum]|nr:hypothetical protein Pcac1_g15833 [Phytophthora cactorum]